MSGRAKAAPAGLEIVDNPDPGYRPLVMSDGDWMTAIMNGSAHSWRIPDEIEVHPNTDELFVLVSGRAVLLMGGTGAAPGHIRTVEVRPGALHNVKRGAWHASPMTTGARLIIVERKGTPEHGVRRLALTA